MEWFEGSCALYRQPRAVRGSNEHGYGNVLCLAGGYDVHKKRAGASRPGPPGSVFYRLLANYILAPSPTQRPGLVIQTGDDGGVCPPTALDLVGHLVVARDDAVVAQATKQFVFASAACDLVVALLAVDDV
jgi:hypothetical protein